MARCFRSETERCVSNIGICTFSSAVKVGSRWKAWKMKPISWARYEARSARSASEAPRYFSVPALGWSSAPSIWSSVDFPEPLGPTIATNSPCWMRKSTPRSACTCPSSYSFFSPLASNTQPEPPFGIVISSTVACASSWRVVRATPSHWAPTRGSARLMNRSCTAAPKVRKGGRSSSTLGSSAAACSGNSGCGSPERQWWTP